MGGRPGPHLHVDGDTLLHRLPAQAKILGLVVFAFAVIATPNPGWVPLGVALLLAAGLVVSTRVAWRHVRARLLVEVPFLVFAALLPFVATGSRVSVGPLELSRPGLVAAGHLAAKATAAVLAATAFGVTTSHRDVVAGLQRLRLPSTLVAILSFMLRYVTVVGDEMTRMRIARESRGFRGRSVRSWPVLASTLGALFIRSYERGDRVHVAMLSRGWTGRLPDLADGPVPVRDWVRVLVPAAVVAATSVLVVAAR